MKVRRYNGHSLEKIREVINKDFGENAVIVNIKKIKKASIIPGKSNVTFEVTAAVDDAVDAETKTFTGSAQDQDMILELMESQKQQYRGLRQSMKFIDEKLADLDERMNSINMKNDPLYQTPELKNIHNDWHTRLIDAVHSISTKNDPEPIDWHESLAGLIPTAGGILFRKNTDTCPDVYVLAGPTGVGKTTTLAKLAAKAVLGNALNVGVLTIDTFRVAAVDQLREYANLLGIEMQVAFTQDELRRHLDAFRDKDVVFIDSPGRSQFDEFGITSIKDCIGDIADISVLLAIPANVRQEDAEAIYESYKVLDPVAVVITKSDEAIRCDGLTKLFDIADLPAVYITNGQRVPEDIETASPGAVASLIMPFDEKAEVKVGKNVN